MQGHAAIASGPAESTPDTDAPPVDTAATAAAVPALAPRPASKATPLLRRGPAAPVVRLRYPAPAKSSQATGWGAGRRPRKEPLLGPGRVPLPRHAARHPQTPPMPGPPILGRPSDRQPQHLHRAPQPPHFAPRPPPARPASVYPPPFRAPIPPMRPPPGANAPNAPYNPRGPPRRGYPPSRDHDMPRAWEDRGHAPYNRADVVRGARGRAAERGPETDLHRRYVLGSAESLADPWTSGC